MAEDSEEETQSIVNQNFTSILDYFTNDETTNKAKCNVEGCTKEFTLPLNEVIARNHFDRFHRKEWEIIKKNLDKNPKPLQNNNKIKPKSNINNENEEKNINKNKSKIIQ